MTGFRSFRGARIVITGASSGIGEALALHWARHRAHLALVARRKTELERVAGQVRRLQGHPLVVSCDVSQRSEVFAAAQQILEAWGQVDILVNNAGQGSNRPFIEWAVEDIERIVHVNYLGTVYWTSALLPNMVQQGRGSVVVMASVAGRVGIPNWAPYVATKFAVVGFAEALSHELETLGVHVLTVCPGAIDTPFFTPDIRQRLPRIASLLMVNPDRVARATCHALRRGKYRVIVPLPYHLLCLARLVAPALLRPLVKLLARVTM